MFKTMVRVVEPDRDTRALIYQQVQDLEMFARGLGGVIVRVEELRDDSDRARFRAIFVLAPETLGLKLTAEDDTIDGAILATTALIKKTLPSVLNALGDQGISLWAGGAQFATQESLH